MSFDHVGGIALIVARTVCHGFAALHHAQMHAITISTHAHPSAASPRQATTRSNPTTGDRQAPTVIMTRSLVTATPVRRRASVPVSSVGWRTVAKVAEWLTGMSWDTRPACSALR